MTLAMKMGTLARCAKTSFMMDTTVPRAARALTVAWKRTGVQTGRSPLWLWKEIKRVEVDAEVQVARTSVWSVQRIDLKESAYTRQGMKTLHGRSIYAKGVSTLKRTRQDNPFALLQFIRIESTTLRVRSLLTKFPYRMLVGGHKRFYRPISLQSWSWYEYFSMANFRVGPDISIV